MVELIVGGGGGKLAKSSVFIFVVGAVVVDGGKVVEKAEKVGKLFPAVLLAVEVSALKPLMPNGSNEKSPTPEEFTLTGRSLELTMDTF